MFFIIFDKQTRCTVVYSSLQLELWVQNTIEKSAAQHNSFYRNVSISKLYNIRGNRYNYYIFIRHALSTKIKSSYIHYTLLSKCCNNTSYGCLT